MAWVSGLGERAGGDFNADSGGGAFDNSDMCRFKGRIGRCKILEIAIPDARESQK